MVYDDEQHKGNLTSIL